MDDEQRLLDLGNRARQHWELATERHRALAHDAVDGDGSAPLTQAEMDVVIDGAIAKLARTPVSSEKEDQSSDTRDAQVIRPSVWRWRSAALGLSAAAALMLWWRAQPDTSTPILDASYQGQWSGGDHSTRSVEEPVDDVPRLRGATMMEWTLSPEHALNVPVDVRIHATSDTGPRCLVIPPQHKTLHPKGGILITGRMDDVLGLPPGLWTLTALVATKQQFETLGDPCAQRDEGSRPTGVKVADTQTLVVVPSA